MIPFEFEVLETGEKQKKNFCYVEEFYWANVEEQTYISPANTGYVKKSRSRISQTNFSRKITEIFFDNPKRLTNPHLFRE